jgi:hypothetical protein
MTPPVTSKSKGLVVRILQRRLNTHMGKGNPLLQVTGVWDLPTGQAVNDFKRRHAIPVSKPGEGSIPPVMWRKLLHPRWKPGAKDTPSYPKVPREGVDYAWTHPNPSALRKAGKTFACRYLSHDAKKDLDSFELKQLRLNGINPVLVWETTANRATAGYAAGRLDAQDAVKKVAALGLPNDGVIYFAVDFDTDGSNVAAYFLGVNSVIGVKRTGAYGGLHAVTFLHTKNLATYLWQTYAWSGGVWFPGSHIQQYKNGVVVAGVSMDLDRATKPYFGQY